MQRSAFIAIPMMTLAFAGAACVLFALYECSVFALYECSVGPNSRLRPQAAPTLFGYPREIRALEPLGALGCFDTDPD